MSSKKLVISGSFVDMCIKMVKDSPCLEIEIDNISQNIPVRDLISMETKFAEILTFPKRSIIIRNPIMLSSVKFVNPVIEYLELDLCYRDRINSVLNAVVNDWFPNLKTLIIRGYGCKIDDPDIICLLNASEFNIAGDDSSCEWSGIYTLTR